jgi:hypothetical protein
MRMSRWVPVLLASSLLPGVPCRATDLGALLGGVAANARYAPPIRAAVRFETPRPDGVRTTDLTIYGRGVTVRVDGPDGLRALAKPRKCVVASPGEPPAVVREKVIGGSAFLLEDLVPFTAGSLRVPLINDEGPRGIVVAGEPVGESPYALLAYTIAADRPVITAIKFYRWEVSNLTKMTAVQEWVQVAGHWRPRVMTLQDLGPGGDTTTITFTWQEAPDLPAALFTPSGLATDVPR